MALSGVFCHASQPLFLPQSILWESVSQSVKDWNGNANDFDGLAVGVEYAKECIYSFCHYQNQSINLQASRFQTNSELEQQYVNVNCSYKNFFVTLICCVGQMQNYTLCGCKGLLFSYQYLIIWPFLASRLLMQEKTPFIIYICFRYVCPPLLGMGVLPSLFGSSRVRTPVETTSLLSQWFEFFQGMCPRLHRHAPL